METFSSVTSKIRSYIGVECFDQAEQQTMSTPHTSVLQEGKKQREGKNKKKTALLL